MNKRAKHLLLHGLLFFSIKGIAQHKDSIVLGTFISPSSFPVHKDSASSGWLVAISYAGQLPGGNLAQTFGFNSNFQGGVLYKTQSNWQFGGNFSYIFGNQLRAIGILDTISTTNGNLIANDGNYPGITYLETGFEIQLTVEKLFPVSKNLNSGILVSFSAGYIQHHISLKSTTDWTPQIDSNYSQGYDRLTAGVCVTEFVGYQYISKKMYLALFAGFEFTEAMAKSLRYNFDLESKNPNYKYEMLSGFRVGWMLPILQDHTTKFYTH